VAVVLKPFSTSEVTEMNVPAGCPSKLYPPSQTVVTDEGVVITANFADTQEVRNFPAAQVGDPMGEIVVEANGQTIVVGHPDVVTQCPCCGSYVKMGRVNLSRPEPLVAHLQRNLDARGVRCPRNLREKVEELLTPYCFTVELAAS
jgi:hypothetical protein